MSEQDRSESPPEQPLATRAEVAEYLQVPVGTLEQWAYRSTGLDGRTKSGGAQ